MSKKLFSINDLNATSAADEPIVMPWVNEATGEETGIEILVLSEESTKFKEFVRKSINARRSKEFIQAKTGKQEVETYEQTEDNINKAVAARIVGWNGIEEEFTPELALQLVSKNESLQRQVLAASSKPVDFLKNK